MALKKWGEVQTEKGFTVGIIGGIVCAVIGFLVFKGPQGAVVGFAIGFIVGHFFDPVKTVIYKEE